MVEIGYAPAFGLAYNAAVWMECRRFAKEFLKEARRRLDSADLRPLWDKAAAEYEVVYQSLRLVHETYPFDPQLTMDQIGCDDRSSAASAALTRARKAEEAGLEALAAIGERLKAHD